jgi:hypothetical protein
MNKTRAWIQAIVSNRYFPLFILIATALVIGVYTVDDYGESHDEMLRYRYAERSLSAYLGEGRGLSDEKGSSYVMLAKIGSELLLKLKGDWQAIEAWHFMHFFSFLLGVFFFYVFMIRFANGWVALGGTLLFITQPLLWGHAFINPKDIPFMSFFLGSVTLGLLMYDAVFKADHNPVNQENRQAGDTGHTVLTLADDWKTQKRRTRRLALLISGLLVGLLLGLLLANTYIHSSIAGIIQQAYHAGPSEPLGRLFASFAENQTDLPVELYIQKGLKLYQRSLGIYALGCIGVLIILALILFPSTRRQVWRRNTRPFVKATLNHLSNKWVIAAGVMLGLTAAIRVLGPAAGLLVAGYFLLKKGRKALPILLAYFALAAIVTYLTWPALWSNPIQSYLGSITLASDFPWEGKVMFGGVDYPVDDVPRSYLPTLVSLQVTVPTLLLFLFGLGVAAYKSFKHTLDRELVLLLVLWLIAPVIAVLVLRPTIYDNFRQFLFILPSLFLFAGIGLGALFNRFKRKSLFIFLVTLLILPGIYWNIKLHPYQYIYYNTLTGGVRGAFRQYEMDYWATSYREATAYLNQVAPPDSTVIVWGPEHIAINYARQDLSIREYHKDDLDETYPADYAIISTRHNKDLTLFPETEQIFSVGRQDALFVVVKQFDHTDPPDP